MGNLDTVETEGMDLFVRGEKDALELLLDVLNGVGFTYFGNEAQFKLVLHKKKVSTQLAATFTARWEPTPVPVEILPILLQQNRFRFADIQLASPTLREVEYEGSEFYLSSTTNEGLSVIEAIDATLKRAA
jgi:hypothetical protein